MMNIPLKVLLEDRQGDISRHVTTLLPDPIISQRELSFSHPAEIGVDGGKKANRKHKRVMKRTTRRLPWITESLIRQHHS